MTRGNRAKAKRDMGRRNVVWGEGLLDMGSPKRHKDDDESRINSLGDRISGDARQR